MTGGHSSTAFRFSAWALVGAAFLSTACGASGEPESPVVNHPKPVHIGPGEIGTVVGAGERRTDPVDANADGKVDAPIPALEAHLDTPMDTAFSADGQLFVIDWNGHKIRALDDKGNLEFMVGTGKEGDACEAAAVDGKCPIASAELNHPTDIAFDPDGRLVIAAWHNAKIKRADLTTGLLENVCGTGNRKFEPADGSPSVCNDPATGKDLVSFDLPSSVAFDAQGNLFISDQANQVIRRLAAADGMVKIVAGSCPGTPGFGCPQGRGYSGDGAAATAAKLSNNLGQGTNPQGKIAFDTDGNLYIADSGNNVVRKVTPGSDGILGDGSPDEEIITTVAGTGAPGYSGDGGPATAAQLFSPTDVAVDKDGTLFIADRANNCIRKVTPDGTISTVAGSCGVPGFSGDGELATEAGLRQPYGVELDGRGGLYIADTQNHCIRKVVLSAE
jgi:sugar lactone lactonase YvrE